MFQYPRYKEYLTNEQMYINKTYLIYVN